MWRSCAEGAGAAKSKLAPACGCARRGKEAAQSAGGVKAQNNTEDGGQEANGVHSSAVVGVWRLPNASFRGGR